MLHSQTLFKTTALVNKRFNILGSSGNLKVSRNTKHVALNFREIFTPIRNMKSLGLNVSLHHIASLESSLILSNSAKDFFQT